MKWSWMAFPGLVWGVLIGGVRPASAEGAKPEVLAGWFGVFPDLGGYQRSFLAPVVDRAKPTTTYRQTARYEWTGSSVKLLEVTLARDPRFKDQLTAAVLKRAANPPREVRIGKRTGWLWNLGRTAGHQSNPIRGRLVVPLGVDRMMLLEARGPGPWEELTGLAEHFDLAAIDKALANSPRTNFQRQLVAFRALRKGIPYADVLPWVGAADRDVGSGIHVLIYHLPDGTKVYLGFPDFQNLLYARHEDKSGKTSDLAR